jgi:hypothetical protein
MSALMHLLRCIDRALRRAHLRMRISQLRQLLTSPDLMLNADALTRAMVEAKLAELRCELFALGGKS